MNLKMNPQGLDDFHSQDEFSGYQAKEEIMFTESIEDSVDR